MSVKHSRMTAAKGNHVVQRWVVLDAPARAALVLTAEDVGGVCRQLSDNTWWRLDSEAGPTWTQWGGAVVVPVPSVFGRTGDITAQSGDYSSTLVTNTSSVPGASVTSALDNLQLLNLSVSNVAALSALDVSGMTDGAHVWVKSYRDWCTLRTTSDAAAADYIFTSTVAGRKWYRCLTCDPTWARQDDFYVSSTTGNNENDGSVGSPVRQLNEVVRRLGVRYRCRLYGQTGDRYQNITILDDCAEFVVWDTDHEQSSTGKACIRLQGNLTQRFSGTVSAKTDTALASRAFGAITSTWTPATEINKLIKHTNGSEFSAWVAKDNGGGSARHSPLIAFVGTYPGISASGPAASAVGNPVSTWNHTGRLMSLYLRNSNTNGFMVQDLDIYNTLICSPTGSQTHFVRCLISATVNRIGHGITYFTNCNFTGNAVNFSGNDGPASVAFNGGMSRVTFNILPHPANLYFNNAFLFQGVAQPLQMTGGILRSQGGIQFGDCSGDALVTLTQGARLRIGSPLADGGPGTNTASYCVRVQPGCDVTLANGVSVSAAGAIGDIAFGLTTATRVSARAFDDSVGTFTAARALTWANLVATVASGGFGGAIQDQMTGCRVLVN